MLYIAVFVGLDYLQGPLWRDERHFWEATLHFSNRLIPTLEDLKSYEALNTPLPFIIFGIIENLFRQGVFAGRLFNLLLSLVVVFMVGWPNQENRGRAIPCLIGLLIYPYFLQFSGRLFTDTIACFWVMMGLLAYIRDRHLLSYLSFILAIASRQYMLAFPAAIATYEFMLSAIDLWRFQTFDLARAWRWILPSLAVLSIVGWLLLFQGAAPQVALETQETVRVHTDLWALKPKGIMNFLSAVGAYIVIPEFILLRRWKNLQPVKVLQENKFRIILIAVGLLIWFFIYPPTYYAGGIVINAIQIFRPYHLFKMTLFYGLCLMACLRFLKPDLMCLFVLCNSLIMLKAYPWPDKYIFQLIAVFWYFKSAGFEEKYTFAHLFQRPALATATGHKGSA